MTIKNGPDDPAQTFIRDVGQRVRTRREAAGLTQSQLERDAGLRPTTITRLERGEHDVEVYDLYRIAQALDADLAALITPDPGTRDPSWEPA